MKNKNIFCLVAFATSFFFSTACKKWRLDEPSGGHPTKSTAILLQPSLVVESSHVSQFIACGTTGTTDAVIVTYLFKSLGGNATLSEFKCAVGDGATSVRVGGVSAPVIGGIAYITGLNLVTNQMPGINVSFYVSYSGIGGVGTLPSLRQCGFQLISVKYTDAVSGISKIMCVSGCTQTMNPVVAPIMMLVTSRPGISFRSPAATILSSGMLEVAEIIVTADTKGDIKINKIPLQFNGTTGVGIGNGSLIVKDAGGNIIATTSTILGAIGGGPSSNIIFTNGYTIPAGTTKTFKVFALISVTVPVGQYLNTSMGSLSNFEWTDMTSNVLVSGSLNSKYYFGWPTSSVTLSN